MKHLAVARLWFEGNSFCPRLTTFADFQAREWHDAGTAPNYYRGSHTEMGGVIEWIDRHAGAAHMHILRCAAAAPGGPIEAGTYKRIKDDILLQLTHLHSLRHLDGIYLSLHGAMVAEDNPRADYHLVKRVRSIVGPACPIALSFDLHANLDPELAELAQIIVGYKTYPHIDMAETAKKALDLLNGTMHHLIQPLSTITSAQLVLPSHLMTTAHGPMAELEQIARELTETEQLLDITPFGGFAYADTAVTSASVSVCVDSGKKVQARTVAELIGTQMVDQIRLRTKAFLPRLPDAEQGLSQAVAMLSDKQGCVAIVDPADNPLSGGIGDTTRLFQALLDARLNMPTVFAFFHDPETVSRAIVLGLGAEIHTSLGARVTDKYGAAVPFPATIELITDGQFVNDGPMEQGLACNVGPSVVLRSLDQPQLRVVISSQCQSPNDMAWCRLHQIDLTQTRLLCVKAKNHFRAAFLPQLLGIIDIDTPGPAMLDLAGLPYQHVQRAHLATPN